MKKIFCSVHRRARAVFVIGWLIVAAVVAASTVLYIGAGTVFDYYSAVDLSENLLAASRPAAVAVCVSSLSVEYCLKRKNSSSD